ncbi:MAG: thiamine pyrophosphate-dependent enzyme [Caldilineaceae bacterium]
MPTMNGGQALIQQLAAEGIRAVFGIPGQGQYEAVDAHYHHPTIRYISVRNEQATTYMADGYARQWRDCGSVGRPGAGAFQRRRGHGHRTRGLIAVAADHRPHHLDRKRGSDQGNQASPFLQELTKWSARATRPAEIPELVHEAIHQLRTGRPRPVGLEIAPAVFAAREEVQQVDQQIANGTDGETGLEESVFAKVVEQLKLAKRPVIWAGGGVQRAGAANLVQPLAELLTAPVVSSRQGKGMLSDRHPLSLGFAETRYAPLRAWLATRDLILAVGTGTNFAKYPQPVIQIDIDPTQLSVGAHGTGVVGDAGAALALLYKLLSAAPPSPHQQQPALHAEVAALNAARFNPADQLQPQWDLMQAIRRALPDDAVVVQGMNQMGYYSRNYFPVYAARSYLTASSLATLGCAFPLALGAKVGQPHRTVVALSGDGGFLYNSQELATAVQYGINVIVILFNDNAYGNVLRAQEENFDGRVIGTELHNPNFVQLAESYRAAAWLARDAGELEVAIHNAMNAGRPAVIEVPVGRLERVY